MRKRPEVRFIRGRRRTPQEVRQDEALVQALKRGEIVDSKATLAARRRAFAEQKVRLGAVRALEGLSEVSFEVVIERRGRAVIACVPRLSLESKGRSVEEAYRRSLVAIKQELTLDPVGALAAVLGRELERRTATIKTSQPSGPKSSNPSGRDRS